MARSTLLLTSSAMRNSPTTQNSMVQPGSTAIAKGDGKQGGQEGTEIGNEPQHGREQPPQHSVGHADEVEGDADRDAVGQVDHELHQEIAADPGGRIVDGLCALLKIAGSGKLDEAVAQVLPLEQHEDHEDDDEAGSGERREQRADDRLDHLKRAGPGRLQPDGDGLLRDAAAERPGVRRLSAPASPRRRFPCRDPRWWW